MSRSALPLPIESPMIQSDAFDHDVVSSKRADDLTVIAFKEMKRDVTQKPVPTFWHDALSDGRTQDDLRGRQVHAAEQNVGKALIGYLVSTVFATVLLYGECGSVLLLWLATSSLFCVPRIAYAFRISSRPPQPVERQAVQKFAVLSVLGALSMSAVPLWIVSRTDGFAFAYLLSSVIAVFVFGCFVHAPVFASAAAFMLTQCVIAVLCYTTAGISRESLALILEFTCMTATAFLVIRQHSTLFAQNVLQQAELEKKSIALQKQADVIGLLLKEHEDQSSDWLWRTDETTTVQAASQRFCQALNLPALAVDGLPFQSLLACAGLSGNAEALSAIAIHMAAHRSFRDVVLPIAIDGEARWWCVSGRPVYDAAEVFIGFRGVMADMTLAKLAEARVVHLAEHDPLTDLPNRASFRNRLDRALETATEGDLAVISIDLDYFKPINDRYGHPVGDAVLVAIAERLRATVDDGGFVARFGGDEFTLLLRKKDPGVVETQCRRLLHALNEPVVVGSIVTTVGGSMGVAFAPSDGSTADELIKNADTALYRAKSEARGTFRFFAADMDQGLQDRQQLVQDLRSALANRELVLHYQPYVDAITQAITGCEALLRWNHPSRGMVSPADFIPLAEESGLIVPIGAWVIEEACREAAGWPEGQRVSINISPVQFRDRDLPDCILTALQKIGLAPNRLEVEVTETVLVADAEAALDILTRIRALGVRIALDDFGTGYSSLNYLWRFPFDKIKIDRSFVWEIDSRRDSQVIVQAIRDIARGLDMTVTAEGVETERQAELLRQTGCQELQGYLFSRPRPAEDLDHLLGRRIAA